MFGEPPDSAHCTKHGAHQRRAGGEGPALSSGSAHFRKPYMDHKHHGAGEEGAAMIVLPEVTEKGWTTSNLLPLLCREDLNISACYSRCTAADRKAQLSNHWDSTVCAGVNLHHAVLRLQLASARISHTYGSSSLNYCHQLDITELSRSSEQWLL